jgi:hypothetical protein
MSFEQVRDVHVLGTIGDDVAAVLSQSFEEQLELTKGEFDEADSELLDMARDGGLPKQSCHLTN